MSGSPGSGRAGDPAKAGLESVVNSEEAARENVLCLKRCSPCGQMHIRSGETCSRECRMMLAEFEDFSTLRFVLENSRWAGALSEEEMRKQYLRDRLSRGIQRLPHSEDVLAEVLIDLRNSG